MAFSLAAILHQVVKNAPSGIPPKGIAPLVGRDYQTLMSELSRQPGHKLGADMVLPLMQVTGSHLPLDLLADELDMLCMEKPAAMETCESVARQCMLTVQDFGRLMGNTADAITDGVVTNEELAKVQKLGNQALASIMRVLKVLEAAPRG